MESDKKDAIVIGLGEVGKPILNMLEGVYNHLNEGIQVKGRDIKEPKWSHKFKFMHICFPQMPGFPDVVRIYAEEYDPNYIIIHSTISPGMTNHLNGLWSPLNHDAKLKVPVFYSPVRGNFKDGMKWSLRRYTKYVAGNGHEQEHEYEPILLHLAKAGFNPQWVGDAKSLEWAKILDLAWYGLNIGFYQELERIVKNHGLNYGTIKEFITSTPEESEGKVQRSLFYGGFIGGHCVIPAIEKVLAHMDAPMLDAVLESNRQRQEDLLYGKPKHHP